MEEAKKKEAKRLHFPFPRHIRAGGILSLTALSSHSQHRVIMAGVARWRKWSQSLNKRRCVNVNRMTVLMPTTRLWVAQGIDIQQSFLIATMLNKTWDRWDVVQTNRRRFTNERNHKTGRFSRTEDKGRKQEEARKTIRRKMTSSGERCLLPC